MFEISEMVEMFGMSEISEMLEIQMRANRILILKGKCGSQRCLLPYVPWSRLSRFFGDGKPPTFNDGNPCNGAL